ncbi:protein NRT1/ PTR FAMILY 4.5-like [Phragmites australis]|uniref:protein NRT1/ PTR FAMILY 4.5-like n=1 Tax=Phragmites australis TaxID=29695 RepID=UPI002D77CE6D|nr:protein NRT1/ PTR FAMILY 4.5-like [Phragmites australis]
MNETLGVIFNIVKENEERSKVSETNGKVEPISMRKYGNKVETHVVEGRGYEVVEGKVDWRGRPALRGRHGGVSSTIFILANFGFENLASLSLAVNLILYLFFVMHIGYADASNLLTNYMGTSYMVAVLISVFADTFIGRYKTVIISSLIELVGLLLLTLQAHSDRLKPPNCHFPVDPTCQRVHGHNKVHLYLALYLIAIGSAGIKAALPAHCADQFDEKHPKEKLQISSCFNWLFLSLCTGGAISCTVLVWIQNIKGWDKGFGVATGVMALSLIVFVAGLPRYRIATVQGSSALLEIFQVYVAAFRNRSLELPENPDELYEISRSKASPDTEFVAHRDKPFRFLDRAAIIQAPNDATGATQSPWRQCRVTQVEHAKTVLAMVPIFCSAIVMGTCLAQLQTFSIGQGATMDTRLGKNFMMPPASLPIIPLAFLIFAVPIYEHIFVPFARRVTGHPNGISHLQRVGVGLVLSIISMAIAALVEVRRKKVAARHGMLDMLPEQQLPISCFWLAPQFAVFGIADMFTYVGLLEFFYSQAPRALKSMSSSFLWCSLSLGYFLSTIIVQAVKTATKGSTASGGWLAGNNINRNHLDLFFWLLAVLSSLNFLNYLFWSSWYKYKPQEQAVAPEQQRQV